MIHLKWQNLIFGSGNTVYKAALVGRLNDENLFTEFMKSLVFWSGAELLHT